MKKITDVAAYVVAGLLLLAQVGSCATTEEPLADWLVGTIAVCVFLVIAFGFMLVNYYYCDEFYEEPDDDDEIFNEVAEKSGYQNDGFKVDDEIPGPSPDYKVRSPSMSSDGDQSSTHKVNEVMSTAL